MNRASAAVLNQHHVAVMYSYNDNQTSRIIDIKSGKTIRATELMIRTITDVPYKWSIYMAAICQNGTERYVKSEEVQIYDLCKQYELADFLSERHSILLKTCNNNHLVNAMWIACPYEHEFTEEAAFELFDNAGGWSDSEPYTTIKYADPTDQ